MTPGQLARDWPLLLRAYVLCFSCGGNCENSSKTREFSPENPRILPGLRANLKPQSKMSEIIDTTTIRKPRLSEDSDSEFDPQFKPVVTLPEVEIVTNEENETVILTMRAKLYRFDTTNEPSEWKERGTGEMKILEHNENHSVRIVMRRDKTFKVCANHFITPWMMLKPCFGSERAFIYSVPADFADEEPKSECFAIKFGSVDNANLFKSKFEETKETLLTKCCLYNGQCDKENEINSDSSEEDEKIAEKLAHLDVSKGESDDK